MTASPRTCDACGARIQEGDRVCSDCGIALESDSGPVFQVSEPLPGFSAGYGVVAGDAPDGDEGPPPEPESDDPQSSEPEPSAQPAGVGRAKRGLALVVLVGVLLALGLSYRAYERSRHPFARLESALRGAVDSEMLDVPPKRALDASSERHRGLHPEAWSTAEAAREPLAANPGETLHEFAERLRKRQWAFDPDLALTDGVHPHPLASTRAGPVYEAHRLLIAQDTLRVLDAWPREQLTEHDATDYRVLRNRAELELLWDFESVDSERLTWVEGWVSPLIMLASFPCCSEVDRLAVAVALLEAYPRRLEQLLADVRNPAKAAVQSTVRRIPDLLAYLNAYSLHWSAPSERLDDALAGARRALDAFAGQLESQVLPRANGPLASGRNNYALVLGEHALPGPPRDSFLAALDELRSARLRLDDLYDQIPAVGNVTPEPLPRRVNRLEDAMGEWVENLPEDDPGVVITAIPTAWRQIYAAAFYVNPGPLGPFVRPQLQTLPQPDLMDPYDHANTQHTLAHESYPGHHMQHVYARESACHVRLTHPSTLAVEGWAVYAEDVLHETRECQVSSRKLDEITRESMRGHLAWLALLEIAVQTRAISSDEGVELMRIADDDPTLTEVDLYERVMDLRLSCYFLGQREVHRLRGLRQKRLGKAFDVRVFHERLLRAGPIPPRLVEKEWESGR